MCLSGQQPLNHVVMLLSLPVVCCHACLVMQDRHVDAMVLMEKTAMDGNP